MLLLLLLLAAALVLSLATAATVAACVTVSVTVTTTVVLNPSLLFLSLLHCFVVIFVYLLLFACLLAVCFERLQIKCFKNLFKKIIF